MKRRTFLQTSIIAGISNMLLPSFAQNTQNQIMTVTGPIDPSDLGLTLPHEHVLVDFIGAEKVSKDRYDVDAVFQVALPYLNQVKELGLKTLVECTPAFIGRDAILLQRLAQATGMNLLTNTGYYGAANDKFVPAHAYSDSAEQLAVRWIEEWKNGIEETGIKPGFIKVGVDSGPLSDIDRKLVEAAAITHKETGLTIASHTGNGIAALDQLEVLKKAKLDGSAFIWVHAQNEHNPDIHAELAEYGAWLEFDGISPNSIDRHLQAVTEMKKRGYLSRLLLSHDAGWYHVGEPKGGNFRPYTTLFDQFIPTLKRTGFSDSEIQQMTVKNPQQAFTIQKRIVSSANAR